MRINVLIICLVVCLTAEAYNDYRNARVDSLEAALESNNPPKGEDLLRAYDELMRGYLPYDSAKATGYGHKALALSYELNGLRIRQGVLRRFAQMYYAREEYDEAIRIFQQALAVVDSMKHDKRYDQTTIDDAYSTLYGAIGNVYNMQDKAHLAIHYYQMALPIFEKHNWLESQVILYYNVGELYGQMDNLDEAERNYRLAIKKGEASGDTLMMTFPKKGLVGVYFNQGDYDKALKTVNEVLAYFQEHRTEEPVDYAIMTAFKARILLKEGHKDVAKAKACVAEALPYIDNTEMMFDDVSTIYMAACEVAMAEKRWHEALDYGLRSIHPDSTATYADKGGYMLLAEIYTELGQKEKAHIYINKVYDIMSRYATDHYQSGLSQMEVLYETQKKEAQIATLDKERGLYRWLFVAAIIAIAALVAGCILIVVIQRRKKALLVAKVALETETKERRILARDLHDGLGGMLSLLRMRSLTPTPSPKDEGSEYIQLLDKIIVELRRTAHHLMPEELLKNGLVSALNDFAISVPHAHFQAVGDIRLDRDKELVLYRCAYELVNNALKHAEASSIDIQLMQDEKEVTLTVSDDGKGMQEGTEGMGLQNIRERIAPYKGQTNIVTANGKGTDIHITLPL
jgi:signal transduction histidine kinase